MVSVGLRLRIVVPFSMFRGEVWHLNLAYANILLRGIHTTQTVVSLSFDLCLSKTVCILALFLGLCLISIVFWNRLRFEVLCVAIRAFGAISVHL